MSLTDFLNKLEQKLDLLCASLDALKDQQILLLENADRVKSSINVAVETQINTLRGRERQLIRQLEVVTAHQKSVLDSHISKVMQAKGSLSVTQEVAQQYRPQDVETLTKIIEEDLSCVLPSPCKKLISIQLDANPLNSAINSFGKIHLPDMPPPSRSTPLPSKMKEEYSNLDKDAAHPSVGDGEEGTKIKIQVPKVDPSAWLATPDRKTFMNHFWDKKTSDDISSWIADLKVTSTTDNSPPMPLDFEEDHYLYPGTPSPCRVGCGPGGKCPPNRSRCSSISSSIEIVNCDEIEKESCCQLSLPEMSPLKQRGLPARLSLKEDAEKDLEEEEFACQANEPCSSYQDCVLDGYCETLAKERSSQTSHWLMKEKESVSGTGSTLSASTGVNLPSGASVPYPQHPITFNHLSGTSSDSVSARSDSTGFNMPSVSSFAKTPFPQPPIKLNPNFHNVSGSESASSDSTGFNVPITSDFTKIPFPQPPIKLNPNFHNVSGSESAPSDSTGFNVPITSDFTKIPFPQPPIKLNPNFHNVSGSESAPSDSTGFNVPITSDFTKIPFPQPPIKLNPNFHNVSGSESAPLGSTGVNPPSGPCFYKIPFPQPPIKLNLNSHNVSGSESAPSDSTGVNPPYASSFFKVPLAPHPHSPGVKPPSGPCVSLVPFPQRPIKLNFIPHNVSGSEPAPSEATGVKLPSESSFHKIGLPFPPHPIKLHPIPQNVSGSESAPPGSTGVNLPSSSVPKPQHPFHFPVYVSHPFAPQSGVKRKLSLIEGREEVLNHMSEILNSSSDKWLSKDSKNKVLKKDFGVELSPRQDVHCIAYKPPTSSWLLEERLSGMSDMSTDVSPSLERAVNYSLWLMKKLKEKMKAQEEVMNGVLTPSMECDSDYSPTSSTVKSPVGEINGYDVSNMFAPVTPVKSDLMKNSASEPPLTPLSVDIPPTRAPGNPSPLVNNVYHNPQNLIRSLTSNGFNKDQELRLKWLSCPYRKAPLPGHVDPIHDLPSHHPVCSLDG